MIKIVILFNIYYFRDELLNFIVKTSFYLIERKNNASINSEIHVDKNIISLKSLNYGDDDIVIKIDEARIDINFSKLFKLSLAFDLNLKKLHSYNKKTNKDIAFDTNISYERSYFKTKKLNLLISNIIDPNALSRSMLHLTFDENRKIDFDVIDIPVSLYKTIEKLIPIKSQEITSIMDFLENYINGGLIKNGKLEAIVPKKYSELSLNDVVCNFEINDIDFIIPNNLPVIKNISTVIRIKNEEIIFDILSGGFDKTSIVNDSKVILRPKEELVLIKAYTLGPTKDLAKFIELDVLKKIKNDGLDLTDISGKSDGEALITIPIDQNKKNIYLIKSKLSDFKLAAFDKKINLESKFLDLLFDGEAVKISGNCFINKNRGYLNYTYNIDQLEIENDLSLDFYFGPQNIMNNITIDDNEIKLSLKYKNKKNQEGYLTLESDLTKSKISLEKLGIIKKFGDPAKFLLSSTIMEKNAQNAKFDIRLISNNVDISGYVVYSQNAQAAKIKIKTEKDNISLDFENDKSILSMKFVGDIIDLRKVNFLDYLEKNNTQKNIDLDLNIKKAFLKNNIIADNIRLRMFCNSKKCTSALLSAEIGSRKININLDNSKEKETWRLFTDNAGAFFKGIGLYTKIKSGVLNLSFDVNKKNSDTGDIVMIENGQFNLDKFVLVDNSLVMKMTSLISLPGLINLITNNHDVKFSKMFGNFEFDGKKFKLTKSIAEGPYFDFTMLGYVDINKKSVLLSGGVTPSVYGISFIVKKIPVVKMLFSSKKRNGIVYAPYTIKFDY